MMWAGGRELGFNQGYEMEYEDKVKILNSLDDLVISCLHICVCVFFAVIIILNT